MNAYDVMDAMNGIAPEKVQHALELMGYIPGEKKKHSARKTLRIVLIAAAITALLTACGYTVGRIINSPEQAWSVTRQELGRMRDMGILSPEIEIPQEAALVMECPESDGHMGDDMQDYWYGRIFPLRYSVTAVSDKHDFHLDVNIATGKITKLSIDARPDEGEEPVTLEGTSFFTGEPTSYEADVNFDDIVPADVTVDEFCARLQEYWGFSGYTVAGTKDEFYHYDTDPPAGDTRLIDTANGPYLTVFFDGDQQGVPMYIELSSYGHPGGVYFTAGTNHAIG